MNWTTPADLRRQVMRLWDKGLLLACIARGEQQFPKRLMLKGPTRSEMADRFDEVRRWIGNLEGGAGHYRVVTCTIDHRILGTNVVPAEVWLDSLDSALAFIGKLPEADRFLAVVQLTRGRLPELVPWLVKRPLRALELAEDWPRLLDIVAWLRAHPRPGIYLRQVDLAGVHSKFIEAHRAVLSELFDLALPAAAVDFSACGVAGFCRRYGFREKPVRLRFRLLDSRLALFGADTDQDIAVTAETFARLNLPVQQVFITENEINFLAFPAVADSMVVFGSGYGFEMLAGAAWLHGCRLYYWGDLDTHGFAILDQLRTLFPHVISFLMDRETLLTHRPLWGEEAQPETRELPRLTAAERTVYDDLRLNRVGRQVRLEQEKIGFVSMQKALNLLNES